MRQHALLLVVLVAVAVFASVEGKVKDAHKEGDSEIVHKCTTPVDLICKYTKKCTKIATKCLKYKKIKHCKVWKKTKKSTKKPVCKKYKQMKDKCGTKKICIKAGFKKVKAAVAQCKKFEKKNYCVKRKQTCVARKLMKRCHIKKPVIVITGPTKCDPGFKLIFIRDGLNIKRECKKIDAGTPIPIEFKTCTVFNDPHITGFAGGSYYDVHKEGDFLMAETDDKTFVVHTRFQRMDPAYAWTGIVGAAISPNGVDVVKIYPASKIVVNDKDFAAVEGVSSELKHGGSIIKTGANVEVFGPTGAKVLITDQATLINVVIYMDKTVKTSGLCDGVQVGVNDLPIEGLFTTRLHSSVTSESIPLRTFKDASAEKNAQIRCKAEKLTDERLKACIFDMMQIKNPTLRKQMLKIEHNIKKEVAWGKSRMNIAKLAEKPKK